MSQPCAGRNGRHSDASRISALHAAAARGERRVVAWGVTRLFACHVLQAPYRFAFAVDADPAKWGTACLGVPVLPPDRLASEDPETTLVVGMPVDPAVFAAVQRQVAALGRFPVVPPYVPALDAWVTAPAVAADRDADDVSALSLDRIERHVAAVLAAVTQGQGGDAVAGRVGLLVSRLALGGAERQMCHLAVGLRRRGWAVSLRTCYPPASGSEALAADLSAAGVEWGALPAPRAYWESLSTDAIPAVLAPVVRIAPAVPAECLHALAMVRLWLAEVRPALLVGYLDDCNLVAGIAGCLAGTPRILMVGRSVHPAVFPTMGHAAGTKEQVRRLYRALLPRPNIRLANNSGVGAASYADWLAVDRAGIAVVPNALAVETPERERIEAVRTGLGIAPTAPVIAGMFRMTEEKQPFTFLAVVERVAAARPDLAVLLAGDGPLRAPLAAAVAERGLASRVHLLGQRADGPAVIAAADLFLQTSRAEGHPNTILEAQALGRPVVATLAGGTGEALAEGLRPFACPVGDVDGLARACLTLLGDRGLACRLGSAAAAAVRRRFTVDALVADTLAAADFSTTLQSQHR